MTSTGLVGPTKLPIEKTPIDLLRQPGQRVAQVDDLVQRRPEQLFLTIVTRLCLRVPQATRRAAQQKSLGESNRKSPETAIGKRRKTAASTRLSCKYDNFTSPKNTARSMAYRLITDDQ